VARTNIEDYLQAYPFWLMDVGPMGPLEAPVFTPLLGFASISSPEITGDVYTFREGNYYFDRHVLKGATIGGFSISRGVTFYDSDFYTWMLDAVAGHTFYQVGGPTPRRNFMLIHYFARNPIPGTTIGDTGGDDTGGRFSIGPFEVTARVPARAYALSGCIPTRWKSGTDFDASSSSVSIAELDFVCEGLDLVDLSGKILAAINKLMLL
jgi:phage tail-like protein